MNANAGGIVVGYDGSEGAGLALDWAAEMAKREGSPLTILHTLDLSAVPQFRAVEPTVDMTNFDEMERSFLDQGVARARKILGDAEIIPVGSIGSAAAELVEASRSADLVVTGSRGRGRISGGLLGSTSYNVTAHSTCPAVVVRSADGTAPAQPGPDRRVVVAIDDSETSERALEEAARIADASGARLHIIMVAQPMPLEALAYDRMPGDGAESDQEAYHKVEEGLAATGLRMAQKFPGLAVDTDVLSGDSGKTVAEFGVDAGLIVVGSRGRGGFTGMLLGSFSHSVIHHATCPVMVIR
ncbi:MAG: universal stress protein [Dermatophilaceae bacterium]